MCDTPLLVVTQPSMQRELPRGKTLHKLRQRRIFGDKLFTPRFDVARDLVAPLAHLLGIGKDEFEIDDLDVFIRLDGFFNMQHLRVVKEADNL